LGNGKGKDDSGKISIDWGNIDVDSKEIEYGPIQGAFVDSCEYNDEPSDL
jgi:hypothetical protein